MLRRAVVLAVIVAGLGGCGGGSVTPQATPAMGAMSPEEAVQIFLAAAQEAQAAKQAGDFTEAGRAYERMAAVFGTKDGSIRNAYSSQEVRDRMVVLAACLRPVEFRIVTQSDPAARSGGETLVTAEIKRDEDMLTLPFRCVFGRGDQWFIEQIHLSLSSFSC
ncbi:MAG: hypothetical protein JSU87_10445 [Gemmatimonadota bacterium]|nr:MAG: hypothetical protein JSU87_10445 [Gemmatimonadota bacterium]